MLEYYIYEKSIRYPWKRIANFKEKRKVEAVLLIGSVAYGTATDDSNLDIEFMKLPKIE